MPQVRTDREVDKYGPGEFHKWRRVLSEPQVQHRHRVDPEVRIPTGVCFWQVARHVSAAEFPAKNLRWLHHRCAQDSCKVVCENAEQPQGAAS